MIFLFFHFKLHERHSVKKCPELLIIHDSEEVQCTLFIWNISRIKFKITFVMWCVTCTVYVNLQWQQVSMRVLMGNFSEKIHFANSKSLPSRWKCLCALFHSRTKRNTTLIINMTLSHQIRFTRIDIITTINNTRLRRAAVFN